MSLDHDRCVCARMMQQVVRNTPECHLLVDGDHEADVQPDVDRGQPLERVHRGRDAALHVARTAADEAAGIDSRRQQLEGRCDRVGVALAASIGYASSRSSDAITFGRPGSTSSKVTSQPIARHTRRSARRHALRRRPARRAPG